MTGQVDRLVLGTLGIGSNPSQIAGYAPVSDATAMATLNAAWSLGIHSADTALSYGSGVALDRLVAWCAASHASFRITAKLGRPVKDGVICPDYSPDGLRREFDTYLAAGLPIDTILIKDPEADALLSGKWESLLDPILADHQGLTPGFSSHRLAQYDALPRPSSVSVAQVEANVVNWQSVQPGLAHLKARGFQVWAMQPLAGGLLTASGPLSGRLHRADWRQMFDEEMLEMKRKQAERIAKRLRDCAPGTSVAASALAFLLTDMLIDKVVIGPRIPAHLRDVAGALDIVSPHMSEGVMA